MTAEKPPVINILREWMMRHPYDPEPTRVIVTTPDAWAHIQREHRWHRDEEPEMERERQLLAAMPVVLARDARGVEVMTIEEYARRYPDPAPTES